MKIAATVALLAAPAVALQAGYLGQMGGGGAMKPSSIKSKPSAPTVGTSYLDNMSGNTAAPSGGQFAAPSAPAFNTAQPAAAAAPVAAAAPPAAAAPAAASSGPAATAVSATDYLGSLKVESAMSGSGPAGYLDALRVQASESAATKPAEYLDTLLVESSTIHGAGPATYLDNLMGAATVTAKVAAATDVAMTSNEPVLAAINKLNENMNKNQQATISVLEDINVSVQKLISRSAGAPAAAAAAPAAAAPETTELTSALMGGTAPSQGGYLSQMGGGSTVKPSMIKSKSFAPTGQFAAPTAPAYN